MSHLHHLSSRLSLLAGPQPSGMHLSSAHLRAGPVSPSMQVEFVGIQECWRLHVFVLQSCLGSTGAFPGHAYSVSSSFCASGNPMTDSILMWLCQFNSTGLMEFKGRLEVSTANRSFAWNCTSSMKRTKKKEASFDNHIYLITSEEQ